MAMYYFQIRCRRYFDRLIGIFETPFRMIAMVQILLICTTVLDATPNDSSRVAVAIDLLNKNSSDREVAAAALILSKVDGDAIGSEEAVRLLRMRLDRLIGDGQEMLGEGYRYLFWRAISRKDVPTSQLLFLFRELIRRERNNPIETFADAPIALILSTTYFEEAKSAVLKGICGRNITNDQAFRLYAALGRIAFIQGRQQESLEAFKRAEVFLPKERDAQLMMYRRDAKTLDYFNDYGDASLATSNPGKARTFWKKALSIKAQNGESILPSDPLVERLVTIPGSQNRKKSDYLADFLEVEERAVRQSDILASEITDSLACPGFSLRNFHGDTVLFGELTGKILVISYWATWCGPCVRELPDIQALFDKYKDDGDVEVLTIAADTDASKIVQWLEERNVHVPVLFDDPQQELDLLRGLPKTTFVDQNGHIRFRVIGSRHHLVEEFSWRIEALKGPESLR